MSAAPAEELRGDAGITLVELLVSSVIGLIMIILGATALATTLRSNTEVMASTEQFDAGMIVTERLSADLRDARAVLAPSAGAVVDDPGSASALPATPPATGSVTVWLDTDADYQQQPAERITWKLVAGRVCRTPEGGTDHCVSISQEPATLGFTFLRNTSTQRIHQVRVALRHGTREADERLWTVDLENAR
ncbi:hypothetical protein NUM3379_04920 [Kineococcus sp. NUM-3379]